MPITGIEGLSGIGNIQGIQGIGSINKVAQEPNGDFGQLLTNMIQSADDSYAVASEGTTQLLSGNVDNLAQIMIDGSKADLSLNLVIQIRNKIVDAYSEIMRMQV